MAADCITRLTPDRAYAALTSSIVALSSAAALASPPKYALAASSNTVSTRITGAPSAADGGAVNWPAWLEVALSDSGASLAQEGSAGGTSGSSVAGNDRPSSNRRWVAPSTGTIE